MTERDKLIAQAEALEHEAEALEPAPNAMLQALGVMRALRQGAARYRALAAQQPEAVEHPLDGQKCEHGYPLSAPSCPLCGGRPMHNARKNTS